MTSNYAVDRNMNFKNSSYGQDEVVQIQPVLVYDRYMNNDLK